MLPSEGPLSPGRTDQNQAPTRSTFDGSQFDRIPSNRAIPSEVKNQSSCPLKMLPQMEFSKVDPSLSGLHHPIEPQVSDLVEFSKVDPSLSELHHPLLRSIFGGAPSGTPSPLLCEVLLDLNKENLLIPINSQSSR